VTMPSRALLRRIVVGAAGLLGVASAAAARPSGPDPHRAILERLNALGTLPSAWRTHAADLAHGEAAGLDDSRWSPLPADGKWKGESAWFRCSLEVPRLLHGYDLTGASLRLELAAEAETIVYVNGARVAMGEELEPAILSERARPGDRITVAAKVTDEPGDHRFRADVRVAARSDRPDPQTLAAELESAERLVPVLADDPAARARPLAAAFAAIRTDALDRADQSAFDRSLREARARLEPLRELFQRYAIRAAGNSHIDMAWLWPWSETVEVVRRTFQTALQLMDEYPDYTFTQSSAQTDAWLEEKYPAMFEAIRRRVREGRWELVGGMWVEPDLNMPDGESIVRQLLVGKTYFRAKFGRDVRIGWNPDSFGYNWQLPQIYKKSGVDFFLTQKLDWNDTTKFPHKLFWWEAPDGSRVLTYFPHDYVNDLSPVRMAGDLADYVPKQKGFPEILHLYGIGDHGGGPTRAMFDRGRKWSSPDVVYPKLFFGTAQGFFDSVAKRAPDLDLPVWKSELYFQYHRGVFTTQGATKRNNRRSEELLLNGEKFSSIAALFGSAYPAANLDFAWKKVLFNQFHDVAAGSGIAAIYRDADRDYADVRRIGEEALSGALGELASRIDTRGPGVPLLVFNPLGWKRSGVVEAEVQLPSAANGLELQDGDGRPVLLQILEARPAHRYRILFEADGVPSLGYRVFHAVGGRSRRPRSDLSATDTTLENRFLRVTVDPKSGCITSLFDKRANREALAAGSCGNRLQAFRDQPKEWDAWNIDANFEDQTWEIREAQEVRRIENGPLRASIRVVRRFQSSTFTQDLTLAAGLARLEVVTEADWHEKHVLVKAAFEAPVESDHATFEIPYGAIERPTTRRTPEEKAQFEVPALRWADLSDGRYGVSLLNDSKYGYDAKGGALRLSLLRSPVWPDPHADEGSHRFAYALYPHEGDWKSAGTMRQGYEFNNRLIAYPVSLHAGELPASLGFVRVEPANVALAALKKPETGEGLLVRIYEFEGKGVDAALAFPRPIARARETDLMEAEVAPLQTSGNRLSVAVRPYEIKTVRVSFSSASPSRSDHEKSR